MADTTAGGRATSADHGGESGGDRTNPSRLRAIGWRLAWHPLVCLGLGAFVGLFVGNVLVTWGVRAAMLGHGVDAAIGPLLRPLVGGGTGYYVAIAVLPVLLSVVVGALVGGLGWLVGVTAINRQAAALFEEAIGHPMGDEGTGLFTLARGHDRQRLIDPARRYDVAVLDLEPSVVHVERDALDVARRRVDAVADHRIPFVDVASVAADGRALVLVADGYRYEFPADAVPPRLVSTLEARVAAAG